jgi:uncharacterized phage-associated protein
MKINISLIDSIDVAKYFLSKANNDGDLITNLKMQKLLYYAQAWYLVNYGTPLFHEKISAWSLGPVITSAYTHFKKFGASPILYKNTGKESDIFTKKQIEYLDEFYGIFLKFSAHELVNMSHNESPWKDAFEKKEKTISNKVIKKYYTDMLAKSNKHRNASKA